MPPPTPHPHPSLQIKYSPIKSAQEHQSTPFKQKINRDNELRKRKQQKSTAADKKRRGILVAGKQPVFMIRKKADAKANYGVCLIMLI